MALSDAKQCTATAKRTGRRCRNPAVTGYDVCRLHGAGTPKAGRRGGRPVEHGRYSRMTHERLGALIDELAGDPDPLDIYPELAAARAIFTDFVNRYDQWTEALLAWHGSFSEKENPKPRKVLDLSDAIRHLDTIARIAQREKKLRLENAISRRDLLRIFTEQRRVVEQEVKDPDVAERILDGFRRITLA